MLGYRDQCPTDDPSSYNYQAGVLHIYTAATGRLVRTILPDATVLALPGIPAAPAPVQPTSVAADTSKSVLDYTHVLWSPDGQQLALTYFIGRVMLTDTIDGCSRFGVSCWSTPTARTACRARQRNEPTVCCPSVGYHHAQRRRAGLPAALRRFRLGAAGHELFVGPEWPTHSLWHADQRHLAHRSSGQSRRRQLLHHLAAWKYRTLSRAR